MRCERRSGFYKHLSATPGVKRYVGAYARSIGKRILSGLNTVAAESTKTGNSDIRSEPDYEITRKARRLAPSLIDAVDWIITADLSPERIDFNKNPALRRNWD